MAAMQLVIDALGTPEPDGLQGIVYGKALASYALEQVCVKGIDQAVPVMRQGLEILRRLGAKEDLAWPQLLSGFAVPDPHEREQNFLESLAIFEELDDTYGIANSLGMILGSHYTSLGRSDKAQRSIERGLAISRSLGDPEGTAAALRTLGHLNLHLGRYEQARNNFREEGELWDSLSLSRLVGEAIYSVGETYLVEGDFEKAEEAFDKSLVEFELVGDLGCALSSLLALVHIAWQRGQPQKAHELLQESHLILDKRSDSWDQARWWQLSGRVSLQHGDLDAARLAFDNALDYSLKVGGEVLTETILDFVHYYQFLHNELTAGRLLGYTQSQSILPAILVQGRIEPLRASLAAEMNEDTLVLLLE